MSLPKIINEELEDPCRLQSRRLKVNDRQEQKRDKFTKPNRRYNTVKLINSLHNLPKTAKFLLLKLTAKAG